MLLNPVGTAALQNPLKATSQSSLTILLNLHAIIWIDDIPAGSTIFREIGPDEDIVSPAHVASTCDGFREVTRPLLPGAKKSNA